MLRSYSKTTLIFIKYIDYSLLDLTSLDLTSMDLASLDLISLNLTFLNLTFLNLAPAEELVPVDDLATAGLASAIHVK